MKLFFFPFIFLAFTTSAQLSQEESDLVAKLNFTNTIPTDLISTRSLVLYQNTFTKAELEETQKFFQQTGIDAVAYFDIARLLAGYDTRKAYAAYFATRGIKFLILVQKNQKGYQYIFCSFIGTKELVDKTSVAWKQENTSLNELLKTVYRFAVSNLKKQNFLINDLPESDITVNSFSGRINENFSIEVKSFKTAIPRFGNEKDDAELETYLKENFPVKYELVDPLVDEDALFTKGFRTILRFVHTRGVLAKDILGYDITQIARSMPTAAIIDKEVQIKTIPSEQPVYKFYFRNIEYGNIFLGPKWDADVTWQDALRNHLEALKVNQKIN
ncbi:MAG: hypothetical protein ACKVOQ_03910 [Cyclobacteriaceae bacterium]